MPDIESSSTEPNTAEQKPEFAIEPELETMRDGCFRIAVSQAEMYRLLGLGKVKGVKAGKRTLLIVQSLKAHVASLPPAKIKPPTVRKRKGA
jgi:hypothetical protein